MQGASRAGLAFLRRLRLGMTTTGIRSRTGTQWRSVSTACCLPLRTRWTECKCRASNAPLQWVVSRREFSSASDPMNLEDMYRHALEKRKITADSKQKELVTRLQPVYEWFEQLVDEESVEQSARSLYVYGGVGSGKTMIMDMMYAACDQLVQVRGRTDPLCCREHFHPFMLDVHKRLHHYRRTMSRLKNPLARVALDLSREKGRLFCLDEFQVTNVADAMILKELFSQLWSVGCTFVITSNRAPVDLYLGGLNRDVFLPFIQTLKDECEVVGMFSGTDYRMVGSAHVGSYLTPLNKQAKEHMDHLFKALCQGRPEPEPKRMPVPGLGRSLDVPMATTDVCRFTFKQLCQSNNMSAADFLCLANNYSTILLEEVPVMDPVGNQDLVRRFINALDVFYDHRVKLFISAEAKPSELFQVAQGDFTKKTGDGQDAGAEAPAVEIVSGGAGRTAQELQGKKEDEEFATGRVVSRLVEMSSQRYMDTAAEHRSLRGAGV